MFNFSDMNRLILLCYLLLLSSVSYSQEDEESNILKYTPSVLLEKGRWEFVSFYNLYTQNSVRDANGDEADIAERQTFLNAMYQFTIGTSENNRFNVGVEIQANRSLYDADRTANPFKVLLFDEEEFSRTVLSAIGPRVRFVPIERLGNFSIQSTFLIPVANDLETPRFTAHDRYTWFTQIFYDHKLSEKWRLFLEADVLYRFKRTNEQVDFVRFPLSAFLSFFPSSSDEDYGLSEYFVQLGIGARYHWSRRLGIEVSYGDFIASKGVFGAGAGYSLNLGFRYIR